MWFLTYGFAEVYDRLLVGAMPGDAGDIRRLAAMGVGRVLNMVEDEEYQRGARKQVAAALKDADIEEVRLSSVDYGGLSPELIDDATNAVVAWLDAREIVYLHCRAGWQRSATIATAVVARMEHISIDEALQQVQQRKPTAEPLPNQWEDLQTWWATHQEQQTS